jgi:hypothetical protein
MGKEFCGLDKPYGFRFVNQVEANGNYFGLMLLQVEYY